jgi:IS5 family transposase
MAMVRQAGFFDVEERLRELSAKGDDLERIAALVDFAMFRAELEHAVSRADGAKGGRPAFDHVLMFKILLLQAMHGLSDERCEYLIKDRMVDPLCGSTRRFLGLGLADPVPDANTIWAFREALKRAGAVERLFAQFDATLRAAGYLAMGGQIVDATIVAAPKQRNTEAERTAIKAGQIPEGWAEKPAKLRQKDRDARWTVKFSKARPREDGAPQVDLAVPAFGYKNHVAIDRRHGLLRGWTASHAAAHDGARLAEVIDADNTAAEVWADTLAFCWSRARREFIELAKGKTAPIAAEVLQRIAALYGIEAEVRGKPPDIRRAVRLAKSRPLVEDLFTWLEAQLARLPGGSPTAKAIRYALITATAWSGSLTMGGSSSTRTPSSVPSVPPASAERTHSLPPAMMGRALGRCRRAGRDAQTERRQSAALLHRLAGPPRQRLAQQPHRRAHAVVLGRRRKRLTVKRRRDGSRGCAYTFRSCHCT